jgi:hypothetical protein
MELTADDWQLCVIPSVILSSKFQLMSQDGGFLGMFAKLQKVTDVLCLSVHLSGWNGSAPTGRIFMISDI